MGLIGYIPDSFGNMGLSQQTKNADDKISQRCHTCWCIVCANGGEIFIEGDIPDIVEAIFNAPMPTIQVKHLRWVCLF